MAFVFSSAFPGTPFVTSRRCGFTSSTDLRRAHTPAFAIRSSRLPVRAKLPSPDTSSTHKHAARPTIAIVGKKPQRENEKEITIDVSGLQNGLFGIRANAYWESMGVLPLFFAGFGITALAIKLLKIKGGQLRGGSEAVKKMSVPKTAITSEAEEAELHVFKCGGCGYEMYPARGREFKFFPDSFKCPLCGTPKSEFWDLNDPTDPRNQTDDEDDEDDDNGSGSTGPDPVAPTPGAAVQAVAEDPAESSKRDAPQS